MSVLNFVRQLGKNVTANPARHGASVFIPSYHRALSTFKASNGCVSVATDDGVAVISMDTPDSKVNTLNEPFVRDLHEAFEQAWSDNNAKSIVLTSAKETCFVAGADINMLAECKTKEEVAFLSKNGQDFFNKIEASSKPVVAAIHGSCMGGGLELALACHYRIATDHKKTALSVPEVMLGLLPGSGGTYRLPRTVGLQAALPMMLTGQNIRAAKGVKSGLVDRVCEVTGPGFADSNTTTINHLNDVSIQAAKQLADKTLKIPKRPKESKGVKGVMNTVLEGPAKGVVLKKAREMVMKQTGGNYPAPLAILDVVEQTFGGSKDKAGEIEADKFSDLAMTKESAALMGLFFGQTACKKNRFGTPEQRPETIGVLGAGLMGAGIVNVSVDKGYNVLMKDATTEGLGRGENQIYKEFSGKVKKKRMTSFERDSYMSKIRSTTGYEGFENADIVIEAVPEDIDLKRRIVKDIESICPEHCVFASNTSALPIEDIAQGAKRPENIVGMHYFSPVPKMPLLEIISHEGSSDRALSVAVDVGLKQGKTVIVVKDGPGFYTTRILAPFMSESLALIEDGVGLKELDKTMRKFGFPVGPITLIDEVGIDVGAKIAKYLTGIFGERMGGGDVAAFEALIQAGIFGRKSNKGFYLYDGKSKDKPINPEVEKIMKEKLNIKEGAKPSDLDVQMRMSTRFANEAVLCLQEGILNSAQDGDIGAVFGLGFPPFLGGPFRWIDGYGVQNFVDEMYRLRDANNGSIRFEPAQMLVDMGKAGKTFHSK